MLPVGQATNRHSAPPPGPGPVQLMPKATASIASNQQGPTRQQQERGAAEANHRDTHLGSGAHWQRHSGAAVASRVTDIAETP